MINILYLHVGAELYGADIVLYELLSKLDKSLFNIHILLPCDGALVDKIKSIDGIHVGIMDYPILRRKYFNFKGILNYVKEYKKSVKLLKNYCVKNNIDIVHSNTSAVLEGMYLKRKLQIKHLWHIHEIILKPFLVYKILSFLINKYSDNIICVSNAVKNHLTCSKFVSEKKFNIIYNGVDNIKFNPNNDIEYLKKEFRINQKDIIVGMIGRVSAWKGQEDFIRAMEVVFQKLSNVRAILIGGTFDGQEWRIIKLKEMINKSKYRNNFILQEYRQDTSNIHCLFDIFVLPSINPDPLPTVVLEAMASGKPIIGYRHGGVTEMVKENYNGLFANVRDIQQLGEKITYLCENKVLREKMSINSFTRQKNLFSLKSYVTNFSNIYVDMQLDNCKM